MAFEGTLRDFSLPDILQLIAIQRKTGILTLESPDDAATVVFQDGAVVSARFRGRPLEERMRRVLPLRGLVPEAQMAEAERAQTETGERLQSILAQRREISKEDWDQAAALEIQEGLYKILRWREGSYRFETRSTLDLGDGRLPPLFTEAFLLEGFRRMDEWPAIAARIPHLEGVFHLLRPNEEIDLSSLSERECRVLALVDGRMRAADVVDASGLGEFEACKALASLMEAGIVALVPGPGEASPSAKAAPPARRRPLAAWSGWAGWALLGAWIALNLLLFRPWASWLSASPSDPLRQARARAGMAALELQLEEYFVEAGAYPPHLGILVRRGMVDSAALRDPWGRRYLYRPEGTRYVLRSTGLEDGPGGAAAAPGGS